METVKPPKSLVDQTYDILLDAICSGELSPGERLNQDEIAARLNVSRQPVNSAISMLKTQGFVEDTGRRGVVVSRIEEDQFQSIYEFRSALEPFVIRLASERKPVDAERLAQEMMQRGWDAVASGDTLAQVVVDMAFHEMLYDWTGNTTIRTTMRLNWQHMRRAMAEVIRDGVAARTSWEQHGRIIDALMRGDVEQAAKEMHSHIDSAASKTIGILKQRDAAGEGT